MKLNENYAIGGFLVLVLYFLFVHKRKGGNQAGEVRGKVEAEYYDVSPNMVQDVAGFNPNDFLPSNEIPKGYDPTSNGDPTVFPMPTNDGIKSGGSVDIFGNFIPDDAVINVRPNFAV